LSDGFEKLPPGIKRRIIARYKEMILENWEKKRKKKVSTGQTPKPKEPIKPSPPVSPPYRRGYTPPAPKPIPSVGVHGSGVPPSEPRPEPEIVEDWSSIKKPTQSLEVTYESRHGRLVDIGIPVRDLQKHQQDIIKRGGRIVEIVSGSKLIFKAPISSEWDKTMKDYYKRQYEDVKYVPKEAIEHISSEGIPESVKYLGLTKEYVQESWSKSLYPVSKDFIGPVYDPFAKLYVETFEELPSIKKFEFGLKFGEIKDKPVGEWRYYEGGTQYLKSLTEKEKKVKLSEYIGSEQWEFFITSPGGEEQLKDIKSSIAREGLGPLDLVVMETVPEEQAIERLARVKLFTSPEEFESTHWESLGLQTRIKRVVKEGYVSFGLAIPSLIEAGLSLGLKTPTPLGSWQQERYVSYTPGFIEAPISELLSGGESPAFERLSEDPERIMEATFKTGAGLIGFKAGAGLITKGVKYGYVKSYLSWPKYLKQLRYDIKTGLGTARFKISKATGIRMYSPKSVTQPYPGYTPGVWKDPLAGEYIHGVTPTKIVRDVTKIVGKEGETLGIVSRSQQAEIVDTLSYDPWKVTPVGQHKYGIITQEKIFQPSQTGRYYIPDLNEYVDIVAGEGYFFGMSRKFTKGISGYTSYTKTGKIKVFPYGKGELSLGLKGISPLDTRIVPYQQLDTMLRGRTILGAASKTDDTILLSSRIAAQTSEGYVSKMYLPEFGETYTGVSTLRHELLHKLLPGVSEKSIISLEYGKAIPQVTIAAESFFETGAFKAGQKISVPEIYRFISKSTPSIGSREIGIHGLGKSELLYTIHGKFKGSSIEISSVKAAGQVKLLDTGSEQWWRIPTYQSIGKGRIIDVSSWGMGIKDVYSLADIPSLKEPFYTSFEQIASISRTPSFELAESFVGKIPGSHKPIDILGGRSYVLSKMGVKVDTGIASKYVSYFDMPGFKPTVQYPKGISIERTIPVSIGKTKPITESMIETIVGPILIPVIKPIMEPVTTPVVKPVMEPMVENILEPMIETMTIPIVEPIVEPVVETIVQPILKPVIEPVMEPMVTPIITPIVDPDIFLNVPSSIVMGGLIVPGGIKKKKKYPIKKKTFDIMSVPLWRIHPVEFDWRSLKISYDVGL